MTKHTQFVLFSKDAQCFEIYVKTIFRYLVFENGRLWTENSSKINHNIIINDRNSTKNLDLLWNYSRLDRNASQKILWEWKKFAIKKILSKIFSIHFGKKKVTKILLLGGPLPNTRRFVANFAPHLWLRPESSNPSVLNTPNQLVIGYRWLTILNQVRKKLSPNFLRVFSTKSTISQKNNKNRKNVFSQVSAQCCIPIWPL